MNILEKYNITIGPKGELQWEKGTIGAMIAFPLKDMSVLFYFDILYKIENLDEHSYFEDFRCPFTLDVGTEMFFFKIYKHKTQIIFFRDLEDDEWGDDVEGYEEETGNVNQLHTEFPTVDLVKIMEYCLQLNMEPKRAYKTQLIRLLDESHKIIEKNNKYVRDYSVHKGKILGSVSEIIIKEKIELTSNNTKKILAYIKSTYGIENPYSILQLIKSYKIRLSEDFIIIIKEIGMIEESVKKIPMDDNGTAALNTWISNDINKYYERVIIRIFFTFHGEGERPFIELPKELINSLIE